MCLGKFSPVKKAPEKLLFCKDEAAQYYLSANSAYKAAACGENGENSLGGARAIKTKGRKN